MKKQKSKVERAAQPAPVSQPLPVNVVQVQYPPAKYLLELARGETEERLVEEYAEVICMLRDDKKFTFRKIALWLNKHGVPADHMAVYRAYTKGMSEVETRDADIKNSEDVQEKDQNK